MRYVVRESVIVTLTCRCVRLPRPPTFTLSSFSITSGISRPTYSLQRMEMYDLNAFEALKYAHGVSGLTGRLL